MLLLNSWNFRNKPVSSIQIHWVKIILIWMSKDNFHSKCKSRCFWESHCVKSVQILSNFWSAFSRIRTEYGEILRISPLSLRIQSECRKIRTRNYSVFGHFSRSATLLTGLLLRNSEINSLWACFYKGQG